MNTLDAIFEDPDQVLRELERGDWSDPLAAAAAFSRSDFRAAFRDSLRSGSGSVSHNYRRALEAVLQETPWRASWKLGSSMHGTYWYHLVRLYKRRDVCKKP